MPRSWQIWLLCLLTFVVDAFARAQDPPSLGEVARQARAAKSAQLKDDAKIVTNDNLAARTAGSTSGQPAKSTRAEDPVANSFLYRIAGRWDFAYVRKGNQRWWPDHGLARPKNEIHYLFGPKELLIESRPEFNLPSIIDRFVYGSVRQVSADLFDVELLTPAGATQGIKRFKLSSDGRTLEIATDVDRNSEPSVQVLELLDATWTAGGVPR